MNGTQNLNIDSKTLDACLKSINQIGSTVYQNVCTGQNATVPWGSLDWFLIVTLGGGTAIILLLFIIWLIKLAVET